MKDKKLEFIIMIKIVKILILAIILIDTLYVLTSIIMRNIDVKLVFGLLILITTVIMYFNLSRVKQ